MKKIIANCVLVLIIGGGICLGVSINPTKTFIILCCVALASLITWCIDTINWDK